MTLTDRIERGPETKIVRIGNRRPVWLHRLDEKVTSHKFTTADIYVNGQYRPDGSDVGA